MRDYREVQLIALKVSEREIRIMKGDLKLCSVINDGDFKEILAGYFNNSTGFTGNTLIEIGIFLNELNKNKPV